MMDAPLPSLPPLPPLPSTTTAATTRFHASQGAGQLTPRGERGLQASPGFVLLSSRGSHELVRKCARVGIAALATLSAPTAMGVRMAELTQLRLWGLCRGPSATLFAPGGIPAQPSQPQAST